MRFLLALIFMPTVAFSNVSTLEKDINNIMSLAELQEPSGPMKLVDLREGIGTKTGDGGIDLQVKKGEISTLALGTVVKSTNDSSIVFQNIKAGGHRALIYIASPLDPAAYEFNVLGAAQLVLSEEGMVEALDNNNNLVAVINKPWALDQNGLSVPTYFEVNGMTLRQVVEHQSGQFTYGISADPFWVPAAVALRACLAHPVCREVAKQGTKAAIKWAMDKLF